jgi:BirA family biotin operon repressor/biotin-[acetyl-CoA-carboxylase] ligase
MDHLPPPFRLIRRDTTESTMEDARAAVHAGLGHGTVCIASRQTRGRGRIPGRVWVDDGGGDLLFTVVLDKPGSAVSFPLTQLMALALCRHLENAHGLTPEIKWPNDVYLRGGKISGILAESEGPFYLAGMGVNLRPREFPSGLRCPAISLAEALGGVDTERTRPITAEGELKGFLTELSLLLEVHSPVIADITGRLSGLGRPVSIVLGDPAHSRLVVGTILGLKEDGALLLDTGDSEPFAVYSGEICGNS